MDATSPSPVGSPGRFLADRRGNFAVTTALASVVLMPLVGLVVGYTGAANERTRTGAALDAAVLAAVSLPVAAAFEDKERLAGAVYAAMVPPGAGTTRGPAAGPSAAAAPAPGVGATFTSEGCGFQGFASREIDNPFGAFIGGATIPVSVAACAARTGGTPACLLLLNPAREGAVELQGSPALGMSQCAGQVNSSHARAVTQKGNPRDVDALFSIVGGHEGKFPRTPVTGASPIPNPLDGLPFPVVGPCKTFERRDGELAPGTYCNGDFDIGANSNVTLRRGGVYVVKDGAFKMGGNATLRGEEVVIALTGPGARIDLKGNAQVTLTSPTSGPYANVQFMVRDEAPTRGLASTVQGSVRLAVDGAMLMPGQRFEMVGSADVTVRSPNHAIIADSMLMQGSPRLTMSTENPRNVAAGPARTIGSVATLVR